MKNYFTKWFPSPGDLRDGDYFRWKDEVHKFQSDVGYGIKTYTDYNPKDGSSLIVNRSNVIGRVKLLFCTRLINNGDILKECLPDGKEKRVHHFETVLPNGVYVFEPWPSDKEEWIGAEDAFKVIGEPSPAATWAQRPMEFDDEDIQMGGGDILYYAPDSDLWRKDSDANHYIIRLKCPCCGSFK